MGSSISKGGSADLKPLLAETQIFALWSLKEVKQLLKIFRTQVYGFALVEAQFESIMSFNEDVMDHVPLDELFSILDNDNDGRLDGLEFLGGLALCCNAPFEDKARFCFELYDFNLNSSLSEKEMVMMMMSTVCGMNMLTGGGEELEPDLISFEALASDAFIAADRDNSGNINYEEFVQWARSNREMMSGLETLNKLAQDAKAVVETDDSAQETDEGELSDAEESKSHGVLNTESKVKVNAINSVSNSMGGAGAGDQFMAVVQWRGQIHEPSNHRNSKSSLEGPETNLELQWAYGVRAQNSRNNLRFIVSDKEGTGPPSVVVYPTATLAVIYNLNTRQQTFFQGHSAEITCLAIHPSGHIVATGDSKSVIHIWDAFTLSAMHTMNGMTKHGIQHLCFSPLGDRIAAVGLDPDHTVTIHDYSTGSILASAKGIGSPNNVFDLAYSGSGAEIVIVGKNNIKFYRGVNTNKRALTCVAGKIGAQGKKQTFFCVTYYGEDAVVGCAGGELYRFRGDTCVQIIQAHTVKEPVLSVYYNPKEGTLATGCKNGVVKTWDSTLKEIGASLDMSEDLNGDGRPDSGTLNPAIISVQVMRGRLLVGTKGGDIFESNMPLTSHQPHTLNRVAWGHSCGELWGLTTHPTRDEFATSGDDKTVRIWSIRSHEQINLRLLPAPSRTLAYSSTGELLCLGMEDGGIALLETTGNMRVTQSWTHTTNAITDVKFSLDGLFLAAGSRDSNIYIYTSDDKKSYRRHAVCRGHSGAVTHIDFSFNSKFLQSNATDYALLFWDVRGQQISSSSSMRDVEWATFTCTLGWPVQGIWPPSADGTDINTCQALSDIGVIVSGDDNNLIKLFRYPAITAGSLHQTYIGHASHVTRVRFSNSRRYLLSIGGRDNTILQWNHELEDKDSSGDDARSSSSSASSGTEALLAEAVRSQVAVVHDRSALQEAVNRLASTQVLADLLKNDLDVVGGGDEFMAVKPWKSAIVEPENWRELQPDHDERCSTDVDLKLEWVHGYRASDCRNNVRYTAAGQIVFFAAALGVVHSKALGSQVFLQGVHSDDILSLAAHPSGQIFATGEAGRNPSLVVWNAEEMKTLISINGFHSRGIHLLSFNDRGNLLASIGMDNDNTLVVHDWAKKIKLFSVPTEKGKVLCVSFIMSRDSNAQDVVVTGGEKHIKFWWAQGQNVKSQKAIWGKVKRETVICLASATTGICVSGTATGKLIVWQNFKAQDESFSAGAAAIQTLFGKEGSLNESDSLDVSARYFSGDKEGNIVMWRMTGRENEMVMLQQIAVINIRQLAPNVPSDVSIRSVCERQGNLLLGTAGSDIYEVEWVIEDNHVKVAGKEVSSSSSTSLVEGPFLSRRIMAAHHSGASVWGLASHPSKPIFLTTGDDRTMRCWSLEGEEIKHSLLSYIELPEKSRALDISPDGNQVAVSLMDGRVLIFNFHDLLINMNKQPLKSIGDKVECVPNVIESAGNQWSQIVKYSFDGSLLAVGSHDRIIYLYDVTENYKSFKQLKAHSSYITHIDFGTVLCPVDYTFNGPYSSTTEVKKVNRSDILIQSTCGAYELLFWRGDGTRVLSATSIRNAQWATFTCTLGWPVQGIWPPSADGTDINAVCRSHTWQEVAVVATADDFGRVRLFNYPCISPGAPDKCYRGHSSHVTNVVFSYNDAYCISTGGGDQCVVVWSTDIIEERRERKAMKGVGSTSSSLQKTAIAPLTEGSPVVLKPAEKPVEEDFSAHILMKVSVGAGDERGAVQPWKGSIREPSDWVEPASGLGELPNADLELKFVYGYRGWDCRNNIGFGDDVFEIVYHVAAVGIVYNSTRHTQIHNTEHDDDILCLAVHPGGHTVATGEIGPSPKIVIWDVNTGVTLHVIKFHSKGVSNIAFSGSGALLVSAGMDVDRIIAVHNVQTGVIVGSGKVGRGIELYAIAVCGDTGFVTGGKNYIKFWELPSPGGTRVELSAKGGIYGKGIKSKTVTSISYLGPDPVSGMSDGTIALWKGRSSTKVEQAHVSAVTSMNALSESTSTHTGTASGPRVITGGKDGNVYIWNNQLQKVWSFDLKLSTPTSLVPQIQAIAIKDDKLVIGTKAAEIFEINMLSNEMVKLVEGHYDERGELWGLAVHPSKSIFATVGDDTMLRVWEAKARLQLHMVTIGEKARALAYRPDGLQIAAGTFEGRVKVLSSDLTSLDYDVSVATKWIQAMSYSPNGSTLAVGSHDDKIYLLDTKTYSNRAICRGHSSFLVQLDFSSDNSTLQSVCGAHELLFWESQNGNQIKSATSVRNTEWATFTCTLGWPVQGIWPPSADGTDINAVDRAYDNKLLITGDDFRRVKLFKYPCPKEKSKFKEYKGHSEHVPCCRFSKDSKWVYSVGGLDKAILQFEVKLPNR